MNLASPLSYLHNRVHKERGGKNKRTIKERKMRVRERERDRERGRKREKEEGSLKTLTHAFGRAAHLSSSLSPGFFNYRLASAPATSGGLFKGSGAVVAPYERVEPRPLVWGGLRRHSNMQARSDYKEDETCPPKHWSTERNV